MMILLFEISHSNPTSYLKNMGFSFFFEISNYLCHIKRQVSYSLCLLLCLLFFYLRGKDLNSRCFSQVLSSLDFNVFLYFILTFTIFCYHSIDLRFQFNSFYGSSQLAECFRNTLTRFFLGKLHLAVALTFAENGPQGALHSDDLVFIINMYQVNLE